MDYALNGRFLNLVSLFNVLNFLYLLPGRMSRSIDLANLVNCQIFVTHMEGLFITFDQFIKSNKFTLYILPGSKFSRMVSGGVSSVFVVPALQRASNQFYNCKKISLFLDVPAME